MNASVGYYNSSSSIVDESDGPGNDFLSDVCIQWEKKQMNNLVVKRVS